MRATLARLESHRDRALFEVDSDASGEERNEAAPVNRVANASG